MLKLLEHGTFSYAEEQVTQTELNRIFESEL
jgi:hypothetical protein